MVTGTGVCHLSAASSAPRAAGAVLTAGWSPGLEAECGQMGSGGGKAAR